MKNILIVDDDNYKIENIKDLANKICRNNNIEIAKALNPGLNLLYENNYDLIILDMSMPVFDASESQNFDAFGGIKFLSEMKRKKLKTPTVIVTQYEIFGEGSSQKTSSSINNLCKTEFANYLGIIIYSSSENGWKENFVRMVGGYLNG